jgi:crotonobetainyl-CoA:carnitine CoA-transferase CaiB-like acyl-CoA transferase
MRGGVADFARAEGGAPVRMLTGPVRVDGRLPPTTAAPALGADTDAVLGRLGLDAQAIASLRGKGTIR